MEEARDFKEHALTAAKMDTRPGIVHCRSCVISVDKRATFHRIALKGALHRREERTTAGKEAKTKAATDHGQGKGCMQWIQQAKDGDHWLKEHQRHRKAGDSQMHQRHHGGNQRSLWHP